MALSRCREAHGDQGDHRCWWCGSELRGGKRRYCSERCSFLWRSNHLWQPARALALTLADGRCEECGSFEDVEVHHLVPVERYTGYSCLHHQTNLRPLCVPHHLSAHEAMRAKPGKPVQLRLGIAA